MKISHLLEEASNRLKAAGIESCELDAGLLLQFLTGMDRTALFLHANEELDAETVAGFHQLIEKRCRRIPLNYITGMREFWSLDFLVNPSVLVPRPETEFLLSHVFSCLSQSGHRVERAMDMCTGSGVIAVVLAKELGCRVTAVDISPGALGVAWENCRSHTVAGAISCVCSDLFAGLGEGIGYDLIVSNPPYIAAGDIGGLEPEVRKYEPLAALAGGCDGTDVILRIIQDSQRFLVPGGLLFMEIGAEQGALVSHLLEQQGGYEGIRVTKDLAGRDRVVEARLGRAMKGIEDTLDFSLKKYRDHDKEQHG